MQSKLNIPKTITVGYRKREDTYTKRLAYVIYTDEKGVLRKEQSWNSWRDHEIEPEVFDNVPTSGFVLNKTAGGYSTGWNTRQLKCRVYDPRGIEFEISIDNLLFILNCGDSYKGKGLSGEFVYAWSGTNIILLPVESEDYKASKAFTKLQTQKVSKSDIVVGGTYINKENKEVVYIGRFPVYIYEYPHYEERAYFSKDFYKIYGDRKHVFITTDGNNVLYAYDGYVNIKDIVSTDVNTMFPDLKQWFLGSIYSSPVVALEADDMVACDGDITPTDKYVYEIEGDNINYMYICGYDKQNPFGIECYHYYTIDRVTGTCNYRNSSMYRSVIGTYRTIYKVYQNGLKIKVKRT